MTLMIFINNINDKQTFTFQGSRYCCFCNRFTLFGASFCSRFTLFGASLQIIYVKT